MFKNTKKFALNFKILRFLIIPAFLVSTPLFNNMENVKAGIEFQWDQSSGFKRLKWFQKENKRRFRNTASSLFRVYGLYMHCFY